MIQWITIYHSVSHEFTHFLTEVCFAQSVVLPVIFWRPWFVFFPFFIWSMHYVIVWVTALVIHVISTILFLWQFLVFFLSEKSRTVDLQHFNLLIMSVIRRVFPLWIRYSRFAITSGYITVNVTKRLKNWKKLCILIQTKSDLLELFYLAFYITRYRWILWDLYFYFISRMTVIINKFCVLYSKM